MNEPQKQPNDQVKLATADPIKMFRDSIEDTVTVCRQLAPHCGSIEQLCEMLELAIMNDGQARWLMNLVTKRKFQP